MTNRLAKETSPYLLQHAHNPVDWYPWGGEALSRAQRENKPILLSIGYAACHWCHVMERESFEDEATATLMNERFVNIKVDREERDESHDSIDRFAHRANRSAPHHARDDIEDDGPDREPDDLLDREQRHRIEHRRDRAEDGVADRTLEPSVGHRSMGDSIANGVDGNKRRHPDEEREQQRSPWERAQSRWLADSRFRGHKVSTLSVVILSEARDDRTIISP